MRSLLVALVVCLSGLVSVAQGQCPQCGQFHAPYNQQPSSTAVQGATYTVQRPVNSLGANDALAEVNATRARRGLRPFLPDPLLTQGAMSCAQTRARSRIQGHLPNDFGHLPPGANARSAGCAAWEPSMGWGACCTYENHTYAGAAWAMGSDGRRYMHIFVR